MGAFFMGADMRIYILVGVIAALSAAYFMGRNIGRANCVADVSQNSLNLYQQQLKKQGEINVEINRTNVRDIRDVLRAKYTIAE